MGTAPLLGWRKTSKSLFYKSFRWPLAAMLTAIVVHLVFGKSWGFPAFVEAEPIYAGAVGTGLAWLQGKLPLVTVALVAYNIAVVTQEFQRGVSARRKKRKESVFLALVRLVQKSRRRYGGYIVHVGIAVMFLGFAGRNWETETEASLSPGQSIEVEEYVVTYQGAGSRVDHEKRIVYATLDVKRHGKAVGTIEPKRFFYKATPGQPSTEVATFSSLRNDLYVTVGMINTQTKMASFRVHVNTLVSFVWIGFGLLILGCLTSMWPEVSERKETAFSYVRAFASVGTMVMLSLVLALAPSQASAQQQQNMKRGGIVKQTKDERSLFKQLLCYCGGCPKEPLSSCTCGTAHQARSNVRKQIASGKPKQKILSDYAKTHGSDMIASRVGTGANQVVWMAPLFAAFLGILFVARSARNWIRKREDEPLPAGASTADLPNTDGRDPYDERLDDELEDLD
jgi:cytochrome c-type biogenesis protein CcmH/NrfF